MATLTPEQRREVELAGGDPVRLEDPITREYYVILKAADYEKLREQVEVERVDPSFYEYGEFSLGSHEDPRPTSLSRETDPAELVRSLVFLERQRDGVPSRPIGRWRG